MIIKGLFRRYERWNPVHPTTGAFWGMGLGVGCGVGWGPGFGPEVIGYVGSGCGVGFSVGFTFLGLGIGLPANYIYQLPCNAVMATKARVVRLVEPKGLSFTNKYVEESWNGAVSRISDLQREASVRLSDINGGILSDKKFDLGEMKTHLFVPFSSISNVLGRFFGRFHPHRKGPQN